MPRSRYVADVREFMRRANQALPTLPEWPGEATIELRKTLIREEVHETIEAIDARDMAETADGIVDSIVVLVGTALAFGYDLDALWDEVQRSNMAKFPTCEVCGGVGILNDPLHPAGSDTCNYCEGRGFIRIVREDGKILKPDTWTPPNLGPILGIEET